MPASPWNALQVSLWEDQADHDPRVTGTAELRVAGGLTLPHRIADRPWLGTPARQAALDALNSSPLLAAPTWHLRPWETTEARATTLHLRAGPDPESPSAADGAAYLNLTGRTLSLVTALRWSVGTSRGPSLPLAVFYGALLSSLVSAAVTCRHVASALDAAEPKAPPSRRHAHSPTS